MGTVLQQRSNTVIEYLICVLEAYHESSFEGVKGGLP
jgi:hypothetical protein